MADVATLGLEDMSAHFPPHRKYWAGREDAKHATARARGAVPNGLTSGNGPLSVPDRLRTGPPAQLGPLNGPWVSPRRFPMGSLSLPRVATAVPPTPYKTSNPGVLVVCHAKTGNTQTTSNGVPSEPVDLRGDFADF